MTRGVRVYFAVGRGGSIDERVCLSVFFFVCLLLCFLSVHFHNSKTSRPNFTKFLVHVALTRSFSGGIAIRYVLPVFWTTSYFYIMGPTGHNQARRCVSKEFARWRYQLDVRQI